MEKPVCAECSTPIEPGDEHLIIKASKKGKTDTFLCAQCLAKARTALEEQTHNPNMLMAVMGGLAGAVAGGLIWYFFVILTDWQVGFIAMLMGLLVGLGVVRGAGRKTGRPLQWISVLLTVVAILFSEYLIFNHFFREVGLVGNLTIAQFFEVYGAYFGEGAGFLDILFFGIALWQAYATPGRKVLKGTVVPAVAPQVNK